MRLILRRTAPWLLAALCAYMMLGFSSQEGNVSASLSGDITAFISRVFTGVEPDRASDEFSRAHTLVRKLAHVSEYLLFASLLLWALSQSGRTISHDAWIAYAVCLSLALADEWLQTGVDGRAGRFADVLIDMLGAALAILGACLIKRARRARKETAK